MGLTISLQQLKKTNFDSIQSLNDYLDQISMQVRVALDSCQWEKAEQLLNKILTILPEHLVALSDLAYVKRKSNQLEEAYAISLSVLAIDPNYVKILDSLTTTCYQMKRFEEALHYAKRSIRLKEQEAQQSTHLYSLPTAVPTGLSKEKARNIISYSLFGDSPRYCECAVLNTQLAKQIYPEWTCRFYVDDTVPSMVIQRLKALDAQVFFVDNDKSKNNGLFWRFLVMSDPNVDCFIIRDADSLLSYKEKAAVDDWLQSGKWFHIMRDGIEHSELILAGMWGGYTGVFPHIQEMIQNRLESLQIRGRTVDQVFLREMIYPTVAQSVLIHDSRNLDGKSKAFPEFPLSDIEKIPYFHIGMIDIGALHTSIYIKDKQAKRVRWYLKNEQDETICTYDLDVRSSERVTIPLPYFYSLKIKEEKWHIHTETLEQ
ncbi:hypothetical protein QJU96_00200 [Pasteurella skyensis]|uniref:Tetratricopeptide repeat-containing protein n=1 Tax=Phocoenobacter skyensis TaxID=97481 RepID=A0AAJ6P1R9_9PAST|nr:hypothetical protein [Pasteurella skyensis]MDP8169715.1 hypothetical protein [Pasteurella skyensis]MDP8173959.1 hypothetical protein [Pasteurella skyensis]